MKLIDMLAGRESDDYKDKPSSVQISVEPSVDLLERIDACAKAKGISRSDALLAYCALGTVAERAANGLVNAIAGRANEFESGDELRQKQLRAAEKLAVAHAVKDALEEAAKACEEVRAASQRVESVTRLAAHGMEKAWVTATQCAEAVRAIKNRIVDKVIQETKI